MCRVLLHAHEAVADAADGEEMLRLVGIDLQLAAQAADEVVERAIGSLVIEAPHAAHDLLSFQRFSFAHEKESEKLQLAVRHRQELLYVNVSVPGKPATCEVTVAACHQERRPADTDGDEAQPVATSPEEVGGDEADVTDVTG